jgi:hypothetical protein
MFASVFLLSSVLSCSGIIISLEIGLSYRLLVHFDAVPYLKHCAVKMTAESLNNCLDHIAASPVYVDS